MANKKQRFITVNDRMQKSYRYELVAPGGRNSPAEMLTLGVFCGKYLTDTRGEFPSVGSNARSYR